MIIIGEKLNSSIPKTLAAINGHDTGYLVDLIETQAKNGAAYLDINTAICGDQELDNMLWLISLVLAHSDCGIMIDSPSVDVVREAIKRTAGRKTIVNSVTLTERIAELAPLIRESGASVVGMPMDNDGIPQIVAKRVENAILLREKLLEYGIKEDNIFIDAITEVICVNDDNAMTAIETIRRVKERFPAQKMIAGISNISFGLPQRVNINRAFLLGAVIAGLDSAIMDINSQEMRTALFAALAVAGRDRHCLKYISVIKQMK